MLTPGAAHAVIVQQVVVPNSIDLAPAGLARLDAVKRVATGWIVQLTHDPLDLDRADHLAALSAAYERYPAIGRAKRT